MALLPKTSEYGITKRVAIRTTRGEERPKRRSFRDLDDVVPLSDESEKLTRGLVLYLVSPISRNVPPTPADD